MRVRDTIHRWVEGKSIVFDDSLEHYPRPMNFPAHVLDVALLKLAPFAEKAKEALNQNRIDDLDVDCVCQSLYLSVTISLGWPARFRPIDAEHALAVQALRSFQSYLRREVNA